MESVVVRSRFYRILCFLLNLAFWISLAFAFLSFLFLIVAPVVTGGNSTVPNLSGLSMDGLFLKNSMPGNPYNFLISALTVVVFCIGFLCVWLLRDTVKSLRSNTPFIAANVRRLRMMGWLLFAQAYLRQLMVYSFVKSFMSASAGSVIEPRFQLLPEGAILAVCILVLAEIFRYGCVLQQEHDTTV